MTACVYCDAPVTRETSHGIQCPKRRVADPTPQYTRRCNDAMWANIRGARLCSVCRVTMPSDAVVIELE